MSRMKYLFLSVSLFLMSVNLLFAQVSDDLIIRVLVGDDTEAPSTPVLQTVTPVAPTQIDLSWLASTDNYSVAGYSILRDGSPIATTTLLSYSDTGLAASTTYSYVVRAFDLALNYSSTSNSLSTTTPDLPSPPPPAATSTDSSQTEGTIARVVVDNFYIDEGISTSSIYLETAQLARVEVRWGRTVSYELGYVVSDSYRKEHAILLTDLEPGTTYEYEVIGYTPYGIQSVIKTGVFTTKSKTAPVSPVNVGRFLAAQNGEDVNLSWQLPAVDSISHVRILRSHLGFPEHPQDGAIIYQGRGEAFQDVGILAQYSPVYYTAFVYDMAGNISSGAVALAYAVQVSPEVVTDDTSPSEVISSPVTPVIRPPIVIEEPTSDINTERVTVEMKMPQPTDIVITQEGRRYTLLESNISLDGEQEFMISIPQTAVAGNLKSIIVTILDPTNNKIGYSYLLRINRDQTAYVAIIPPLGVVGRSQVKLEIYDYEALVVATYQAPLSFSHLLTDTNKEVVFPDAIYKRSYLIWILLTLLVLLSLTLVFIEYRRRGEDNE